MVMLRLPVTLALKGKNGIRPNRLAKKMKKNTVNRYGANLFTFFSGMLGRMMPSSTM